MKKFWLMIQEEFRHLQRRISNEMERTTKSTSSLPSKTAVFSVKYEIAPSKKYDCSAFWLLVLKCLAFFLEWFLQVAFLCGLRVDRLVCTSLSAYDKVHIIQFQLFQSMLFLLKLWHSHIDFLLHYLIIIQLPCGIKIRTPKNWI